MIDPNIVMFLIGQSIVIVGAVIISHVSTKVAIAKIETRGVDIEGRLRELKADHRILANKVDGISRSVVKIDTAHMQCPYVSGKKAKA